MAGPEARHDLASIGKFSELFHLSSYHLNPRSNMSADLAKLDQYLATRSYVEG